MKQPYSKPIVIVEKYSMDMPIAANCIADFDDMNDLIDFGYFGENDRGLKCGFEYVDGEGHDTICYHSNVQNPFLS